MKRSPPSRPSPLRPVSLRPVSLRPVRVAALLLAAAPLLGGCSNLSRTFGFTHNSPDEFSVTTQAPLTMPPSDALHPPEPGASRPQTVAASQSAEEALIPSTALSSPGADGSMTRASSRWSSWPARRPRRESATRSARTAPPRRTRASLSG